MHTITREVPLEELRVLRRWLCWNWRYDSRSQRWKKPPKKPDGSPMDHTDPTNWCSYDEVAEYGKVGIVPPEGMTVIDLDGCLDPATGELSELAQRILDALPPAYAEVSPSERGIKVWLKAVLPKASNNNRKSGIEMYCGAGQYVTYTGLRLPGVPREIPEAQEAADALYAEFFPVTSDPEVRVSETPAETTGTVSHADDLSDSELLERARKAANAGKFRDLYDQGDISSYGSPSEADLALCRMLVFWTGDNRESRVEDLFGGSALGARRKWRERPKYRVQTIRRAYATQKEYWNPEKTRTGSQSHLDALRSCLSRIRGTALAEIRRETGQRAVSKYQVMDALLRVADKVGYATQNGVAVSVSIREVAEKAGMGTEAVQKSLRDLRAENRVWKSPKKSTGNRPSVYTLLSPVGPPSGRANPTHPRIEHRGGDYSSIDSLNQRECVDSARVDEGSEVDGSAQVDDREVPVLRRSAPGLLRLGPTKRKILATLIESGGEFSEARLKEAAGIGGRPRDFRHRHLRPLVDRGAVEVIDGRVRLLEDWREAVEAAREDGAEDVAAELQASRHARERGSYAAGLVHAYLRDRRGRWVPLSEVATGTRLHDGAKGVKDALGILRSRGVGMDLGDTAVRFPVRGAGKTQGPAESNAAEKDADFPVEHPTKCLCEECLPA